MSQKQVHYLPGSGLLGFVLIALKCAGYIDWPWLWVLCPFWIPFAIFGAIIAGVGAIATVATLGYASLTVVEKLNKWLRRKF